MNKLFLLLFITAILQYFTLDLKASVNDSICLSEQTWSELTDQLNYDETFKTMEKKDESKSSLNLNFKALLTSLVFIILTSLVVGLVLWFRKLKLVMNEGLKPKEYTHQVEELEKEIMGINLEQLLQSAITFNDYRSALRIRYLMVIKALALNQKIKWSAEKTNGKYLQETSEQPFYEEFKLLTRNYEKAWYYTQDVEKHHYNWFNTTSEIVLSKLISIEQN